MNRHLSLQWVVSLGLVLLSASACGIFPPAPTSTPIPYIAMPSTKLPASPTPSAELATQIGTVGVPPAGQLYHSAYPGGVTGEEDDLTLDDLRSYEQAVGKPAAWVYFSHNWYRDRRFPLETAMWIRDAGSIPYIRLMLRSDAEQNHAEPTFTLEHVANGDFDGDLQAWARAAREFGSPLIAEFGTEVNGEWFSWNGVWNDGGETAGYGDPSLPDGPEKFRDAYRHIIQIGRDEGAGNILWVFHANNQDVPDESWNRLEQYYPGDEWIDWIGVSVYGAQTPMEEEWPQFRAMMDEIYPRLTALSPNKPIVLLEFGVAAHNPLGDQAQWAEAALTDLTSRRWPRLIGFSWWNERWQNDDDSGHDTTMRVQDNPQLAAAFRRLVGGNDAVLGKAVLTTSAALPIPPNPTPTIWRPEIRMTWQWQLTDLPVDRSFEAGVYDIDLFDNDADVVAALHAQGRKVICYLSAGSWEDWRPDKDQFPPDLIGRDYMGWKGEKWLDIRQIDRLAPVLGARLDQCKAKGFDGVEPDNIDGYTNRTGFPLTADDQLRFNIWLAEEAHRRGLSIGLKNDADQAAALEPYFDWALTEDCFAEGWCEQMLPFIEAGKAVLAAEYTDTGITLDEICPRAAQLSFSVILKNRDLDADRATCP